MIPKSKTKQTGYSVIHFRQAPCQGLQFQQSLSVVWSGRKEKRCNTSPYRSRTSLSFKDFFPQTVIQSCVLFPPTISHWSILPISVLTGLEISLPLGRCGPGAPLLSLQQTLALTPFHSLYRDFHQPLVSCLSVLWLTNMRLQPASLGTLSVIYCHSLIQPHVKGW